MYNLTAGSVAFLASALLIHMLAPAARKIGLVDLPHGHKVHQGQVPLVGGIAMFCGFLFAVLTLPLPLAQLRPLFAGAALLVIIGVLDDFQELGPHTRFMAQIGAAGLMVLWGGVGLVDLGYLLGDELTVLGDWTVPFTIFAVVGVINAFNMLDGMDGLAGSYALLAFSLLGSAAWWHGAGIDASILWCLGLAVCAFLLANLRLPGRCRALVFMGNAGSLFLGLALAWFVVALSQGQDRSIAPVTALWILAVPLMDTVGIMVRRLLHHRSPLRADREHLHHLLLALGLGVNGALTAILSGGVLLALAGLGGAWLGVPEPTRFYTFLGLFAAYLVAMEVTWRRLNGHARPFD